MPALRAALDVPLGAASYDALLRIVTEGPSVGIVCVMTAERPGAIQPALLAACADRWIFHLDDPAEAGVCGVPPAFVPGAVPGRIVVASTRREGQLALVPVEPGRDTDRDAGRTEPAPVGILPTDVSAAILPIGVCGDGEVELVVGVDFESLAPARLVVPDGEHVLVVGPARSGRSTTLSRLAASWRQAHPEGTVQVVCPTRRSLLAGWPEVVELDAALEAVGGVPSGRPCLLVIDDAERVDDPTGALTALATDRRPGTLIVAAARPDALRSLYGHWTAIVRRSRIGVVMSSCSDLDGEVLGEVLPRRPPLPSRPGLGWVVGGGGRALAQVARDDGAPVGPAALRRAVGVSRR